MIAALPIGGRVKLDPWNDKLDLIKSKPVGAVAEREKMPFEVTPFMPYLMRYGTEATKPIAASAARPTDPKPDNQRRENRSRFRLIIAKTFGPVKIISPGRFLLAAASWCLESASQRGAESSLISL